MKNFKRLKLQDGGFCLEGKTVECEILEIRSLPLSRRGDQLNESIVANQSPQESEAYFYPDNPYKVEDAHGFTQFIFPVIYFKLRDSK